MDWDGGGYFVQPEESEFLAWYVPLARKLGIDPNPDAPEHHYDYRQFFREMKAGRAVSPDKPGGHFPSTYKTAGHPRAYLQDSRGRAFDTRTAEYVRGGRVSKGELRRSEQSPDMPGFDPDLAMQMAKVYRLFR